MALRLRHFCLLRIAVRGLACWIFIAIALSPPRSDDPSVQWEACTPPITTPLSSRPPFPCKSGSSPQSSTKRLSTASHIGPAKTSDASSSQPGPSSSSRSPTSSMHTLPLSCNTMGGSCRSRRACPFIRCSRSSSLPGPGQRLPTICGVAGRCWRYRVVRHRWDRVGIDPTIYRTNESMLTSAVTPDQFALPRRLTAKKSHQSARLARHFLGEAPHPAVDIRPQLAHGFENRIVLQPNIFGAELGAKLSVA